MKLQHAEFHGAGFVFHAWAGPKGLVATALGDVPSVGQVVGSEPVAGAYLVPGAEWFEPLGAAVGSYFAGEAFAWEGALDERGLLEASQAVYRRVRLIPPGKTLSLAELSGGPGVPRARRSLAGILARNPWPLVVPCHRVLGDRGASLSALGATLARRLLDHEAGQRALNFGDVTKGVANEKVRRES